MNKPLKNLALCLTLGWVCWACSPQTVPQQASVIDYSYEDDITKYRPLFEPEQTKEKVSNEVQSNSPMRVSFDVSDKLNAVIDSMVARNDSLGVISGYTVLVYSGNYELQAGRIRNRLFDLVPEHEARFSYKLPTYFVKVGQFYQQIEAQALYRKIRSYYPTASIVPDKFPIKND